MSSIEIRIIGHTKLLLAKLMKKSDEHNVTLSQEHTDELDDTTRERIVFHERT